jgi:hypothetical protein
VFTHKNSFFSKKVQMELPRVSEDAARQAIDSTRVFREYVRTRNALRKLEGTMYWKKVGGYEYLAHRVGRKYSYLGTRSPETDAKYVGFTEDKQKLQARAKTLKHTVDTSQRMNKAVRAGTVPTEVIDFLNALEEAGLGEQALVMGSPALYAYGQSSGVRMDGIKLPGEKESVVEDARHHLYFLISSLGSQTSAALRKLKGTFKQTAIEHHSFLKCDKVALEVFFDQEKHQHSKQSHLREWFCDMDQAMKTIDLTPKYEQVVIGKTGRMALMRTVDPKIFVCLSENMIDRETSQALTAEVTEMQRELVSQMLADDMVLSKIDGSDAERARETLKQAMEH